MKDQAWKSTLRFIKKNPLAAIGVIVCVLITLVAIFAPLIATHDPVAQDFTARYKMPGNGHLFGTDTFGRDIFSRVVYGTRVSLPAGVLVVLFAGILGCIYGAIAGYFGKAADEILMRISDIVMSFPALVLAMALSAVFGASMLNTVIIIVLVWWPKYARMMRSLVLTVRETEYVASAMAIGESRMGILLKTIVPNCVSPLLVMASADIGNAILMFSGLGFLGMGVAPPTPEWGTMVSDGMKILQYWWVSVFPGLTIFIVSIAFNFIGDAVRDVMDPKLRNLE